jgi:uncharacterized membrane protein YhaH (DUF805 family)
MDWKTLFFSADGRIGRSAFWMGWLMLVGVNVVLGWIPLIGWLLSLVTIYCFVCVYSKRLHDMGKSGFLQIWPMILCIVLLVGGVFMAGGPAIMASLSNASEGAIAAAALAGVGGMGLAFLLALVISVGFLLWVGLSNGDAGENRYGPAPAQPAVA